MVITYKQESPSMIELIKIQTNDKRRIRERKLLPSREFPAAMNPWVGRFPTYYEEILVTTHKRT